MSTTRKFSDLTKDWPKDRQDRVKEKTDKLMEEGQDWYKDWLEAPSMTPVARPWKGEAKDRPCDFCGWDRGCGKNDYAWIGDFQVWACDRRPCQHALDTLFDSFTGKVGLPDELIPYSVGQPRPEVRWPLRAGLVGAARVLAGIDRVRVGRPTEKDPKFHANRQGRGRGEHD